MAQGTLSDKKYLPVYQKRYGKDFVEKMKDAKAGGTYISEERQKQIREGYTVPKNGNKKETQLQAAATEMLFKGGKMILNPDLMDPLMCARLKLIDEDMIKAFTSETDDMFFKEPLSGIAIDGLVG